MNSLNRFADPVYCIMRLIVGLVYACHGGQKLLGFPGAGHGNSNGAIFPDPEQRRTSYRSVLDISVHRLLRRRPLEHRCIAVPQERSRDAAIDCLTRAKIDVILSDRMNSLNPYTPTRCVT